MLAKHSRWTNPCLPSVSGQLQRSGWNPPPLSHFLLTIKNVAKSFIHLYCKVIVAWMPDELSPAHNIVCSGCSVWHRSVEEKLSWYENQPDQSNCQGGLYTMMNRWSDQSNCQGGLHTMLDRSPVRSSRAGPRAGLPGRGARSSGDTRGSYLAPGRCARRVPLTSGDILHFLVQ